MNYIPLKSTETGSYMCTWHRQGFVARKYGIAGSASVRDALTPEYLFGEESDYHWLPREYRSGLYFVLDDGWDVPPHTAHREDVRGEPFGSVDPDPVRFGSLGDTPVKRLAALNKLAQEWGYIGLGLWISPQFPMQTERVSVEEARDYWKERAIWCQEAGVRYWKVDWGVHDHDLAYRRMLTEVVKEYAPDVAIEHAYVQKPLTWMVDVEDRKKASREMFAVSDFFRTYDVMWPLQDSAVLCRIHELLSDPPAFEMGVQGMLNMEYQHFIAAGLGGSLGAMDPAIEMNAVLRWQRIAPPFSVKEAGYRCSEEMITDRYEYPKNPVGWIPTAGRVIEETAPAVMVRGCSLPEVEPVGDEKPFVTASRNPRTGAYAISTIRRNIAPNPQVIVPAHVTWALEDSDSFVGIFGYFESLTLVYPHELSDQWRIFAQNLMDDEAQEITGEVTVQGNKLTLSGRVLMKIGACNFAYPEMNGRKMSDPMLLIKIEK